MVTEAQRLRARLHLSELAMAEAAKALEQLAEIPAMQREIDRRLRAASDAAYTLRQEIAAQQRDFPETREVIDDPW